MTRGLDRALSQHIGPNEILLILNYWGFKNLNNLPNIVLYNKLA